jgi:hypothetical protein
MSNTRVRQAQSCIGNAVGFMSESLSRNMKTLPHKEAAMKTPMTACLLALTMALSACAIQPANEQTTPTGQVPQARVYIKSMLSPLSGTAQVQFSRGSSFFSGNAPLELAINDVVLAQIQKGEGLSIWLKPGTSYDFSIKPVHSLNSATYPQTRKITVDLKNPGTYKIVIGGDREGPTLQQEK